MKKPEILSPAGNMECLKAAILAGCDAVYLGGYMFGARSFAGNFSNEELIEAIKYAHVYGVKVYVTVNTLIYENEVDTFIEYIRFLYINNVDAVIVQDIGMMDLIIQMFPDFEVHASTQMHIHNLEATKLVESLGVKRVVLARETSIDDIKKIKENTNIELEIFVHGALCISYSGQCLMSSLIGNRSGNRGTCAGTCRQRYDVLDKNKNKRNDLDYNLSTKDLNSLDNIGKLIDIGVDSLKIEGRMKSASYVYLVTKLYREAVDSYIEEGKVHINLNNLNDLKKTFNRMFTRGFLFNTNNNDIINPYRPNHLGIEIGKVIKTDKNKIYIKLTEELSLNDGIRFIGKEDSGMIVTKMEINHRRVVNAKKDDVVTLYINSKITINSIVVKTTDYLLNKKIEHEIRNFSRKIMLKGNLIAKLGEPISMFITDGNIEIIKKGIIPEKAINSSSTKEQIEKQIYRTGNTAFEFEEFSIELEDNLFIPIKALNDLRREILNDFALERSKIKRSYQEGIYKRNVKEYNVENIKSIYIQTTEQYEKIKDKDYKYIYMDNLIYDDISDERKKLKLPRVITTFKNYDDPLLVGELGSIFRYKNVDTDFSLNVVNSYSVALLENLEVNRVTVSYELTYKQLEDMIEGYKKRYNENPNLAIIIYAKEEMMISKFNLLEYYDIEDYGYLKDRFNNLYKVTIKDNLMYINNYKARNDIDYNKYFKLGVSEIRYNIIDEEDLKYI